MPTPQELIAKVEKKFIDTSKLRQRMDADYALWTLQPFNTEGLDGYKTYTSNEPKTFGRKAVALLASAVMAIRCPQNNDPRETRDQDNAKEQFAIGNFKANDERLVRMGGIPLRRAMSWHLLNRGWTAGRSVLRKHRGRTWADATPWDPRGVAWEYGADGLAWICHRTAVLRSVVEQEWGLERTDGADETVVTQYDYYDDTFNYVIVPDIRDTWIKRDRHSMVDGYGTPRVAAWCIANPLQPLVQDASFDSGAASTGHLGDALADYGESIYAENRGTIANHNFNMSILKNLAERSLKPVFGIRSQSGVKLVEGDPFRAGAEIPLAEGEELIVYDFLKSAPDMMPYMQINQGEIQRGYFPVIMHGELPAPISGYMGTILKSGPADKVMAAAEAMQLALKQITNMWCDQFSAGGFGSFELSGVGGNRKWFISTITPDQIQDLPELEVTLKPQLPEDDASKVQLANMLRQPGVTGHPLLSDYDIRENYLERQDSDRDQDAIWQELAVTKHPLALAHTFADALAKRGDERAQYYHAMWMQMILQMMQQGMMPPDLQAPQQGPSGAPQGANGGFSPETLPNAAQGIPAPTPGINTPFQQGPLVPQGTPRPGAGSPNGNSLRRY